jgi:predicted RNA-binding protein with PUA-like domain
MAPRHWLMKSEPQVYGLDALERDGVTGWEGVRNYQARNLMRDEMGEGDLVLFYHSNADPAGVAGVARVASPALPDPSQFDRKSELFDPRSTRAAPRWQMVKVAFVERFPALVTLARLRATRGLAGMPLLQRGQRLSVQPVSPAHFKLILALGRKPPRG